MGAVIWTNVREYRKVWLVVEVEKMDGDGVPSPATLAMHPTTRELE